MNALEVRINKIFFSFFAACIVTGSLGCPTARLVDVAGWVWSDVSSDASGSRAAHCRVAAHHIAIVQIVVAVLVGVLVAAHVFRADRNQVTEMAIHNLSRHKRSEFFKRHPLVTYIIGTCLMTFMVAVILSVTFSADAENFDMSIPKTVVNASVAGLIAILIGVMIPQIFAVARSDFPTKRKVNR